MADIFSCKDARHLLKDKFIFILGDSNLRATYKDLILLINRNEILSMVGLRRRGEETFEGDTRINYKGMSKGRQYVEGRRFLQHGIQVEYHFITKCYTPEIVNFLHKIKDGSMKTPDVMIMNSCIWDISRWGPNGVEMFKDNMKQLMILLNECLPKKTLFIWTNTLPVSKTVRGGLLIKQLDFMEGLLRFQVMEANLFCRRLVVSHGYDVLDTHYYLRMQIHRRLKDGIHYGPLPVRFVSNLILTHISLSWDVPLPGNVIGIALERVIKDGVLQTSKSENIKLPPVPPSLMPNEQESEAKNSPTIVPHPKKNSERPKGNKQTKRGKFRNTGSGVSHQKKPPVWQNDAWQSNDCTWVWQQKHASQQQQQRYYTQNEYWSDYASQRYGFEEDFGRSNYSNFDRVPSAGPVRKNNKFSKNRSRPY